MNYCQLAKIVIKNPFLLRVGRVSSSSIRITRDGDKFKFRFRTWVPGTYRNDDEFDDDINTGGYDYRDIDGLFVDDLYDATCVKDDLARLIDQAHDRDVPYEHVLAASNEDLQPGYGEGSAVGYHDLSYRDLDR